MTTIMKHQVASFKEWKPIFDDNQPLRRRFGGNNEHVYQEANHPENVVVMVDWNSKADAEKFSQSPELKEVMQKAGVLGTPQVFFIEQ